MYVFKIPDNPRPPRHSGVTFVVRRGLCVFGPNEGTWMSAWRYEAPAEIAWAPALLLVGIAFITTVSGWVAPRLSMSPEEEPVAVAERKTSLRPGLWTTADAAPPGAQSLAPMSLRRHDGNRDDAASRSGVDSTRPGADAR